MKLLIALFLLLASFPVLGSYHNEPQHPGRHYACPNAAGIAYENDRVVYECGAVCERVSYPGFGKRVDWQVIDPAKLLVKSNRGEYFTPEQVADLALAPLREPFYDRSEQRMVRWKAAAFGVDLLTTSVGISFGGCSEAGPAKHVPGVGLAIAGLDWYGTRRRAQASPRYFTSSRDALAWAPSVTHGGAAVHNLFRCVL